MGRHVYGTARVVSSCAARPGRRAVAQSAGSSVLGLVMVLEIESGVTLDDVAYTLRSLGLPSDVDQNIWAGLLPGCRCAFGFKQHAVPLALGARGMQVEWSVGLTITFHFRAAHMLRSLHEIYRLIEVFAKQHRYRFVLSFQYERIYAVRDESGLDLVWKIS